MEEHSTADREVSVSTDYHVTLYCFPVSFTCCTDSWCPAAKKNSCTDEINTQTWVVNIKNPRFSKHFFYFIKVTVANRLIFCFVYMTFSSIWDKNNLSFCQKMHTNLYQE